MHEWGPGCWGYQGGWGAPHNCSQRSKVAPYSQDQGGQGAPHYQFLCLTANPQEKYAGTRAWGNSRRRMGLLSLCGGLHSGLLSLPAQNLWGTDVSLTTSNWHPASGCNWQRTDACSFHSQCIRDASTSNWCKMAASCIWSGSIYAKAREDSGTRQHSQGAILPKTGGGGLWWGPSKKIIERPSLKSPNLSEWLGKTTTRTTSLTTSIKGSYDLSSTFREMAPSDHLMGSEVHEVWTGQKDLRPLTMQPKLLPRTSTSLGSCHPPNHPKSWAWGGSIPLRPAVMGGLSFCLWCRKGQNEDTMVNHLWTSHYHLGLICSCCMEYFYHECLCHVLALPVV